MIDEATVKRRVPAALKETFPCCGCLEVGFPKHDPRCPTRYTERAKDFLNLVLRPKKKRIS